MKIKWSWFLCLGSYFWLSSLFLFIGISRVRLAVNLFYLLEWVALIIGIVYVLSRWNSLIFLPWKIVWSELGVGAMFVYLVWIILLSFTAFLLEEESGKILREVSSSFEKIINNSTFILSDWYWVPTFLMRMGVTMAFPVLVAKMGILYVQSFTKKSKTDE